MGLFQLVLRVFFELILNIINKGLEILKILLKKGFKVKPHNGSGTLIAAFVLSSSEANNATKY